MFSELSFDAAQAHAEHPTVIQQTKKKSEARWADSGVRLGVLFCAILVTVLSPLFHSCNKLELGTLHWILAPILFPKRRILAFGLDQRSLI